MKYKKSFGLLDILVCIDLNRIYFNKFYNFHRAFNDFLNNNASIPAFDYYLILDKEDKKVKPVLVLFKNIENIHDYNSYFQIQKINFTELYDEYHRDIKEYDGKMYDPRIIKLISTILDDKKNDGILDTILCLFPYRKNVNDYITDVYINPDYKIDIVECILNNKIEQNFINNDYYFLYPNYDILKVNIKLSNYMINFLHNINGKYLGDITDEFNEMLKHYNINTEVKLLK